MPHRPTHIAPTCPTGTNACGRLLRVDNGNLAQQMVYSVANNATTYQGMRYLQWDEDDRLNLVAGDGYLSYYAYGHDGNRAIKMTGNAAIDQTGTLLNSTNLENITIYHSEYLTVTQAEYTKYYYAGGNRIASKIGTGGFEKMTRLCTLDQGPTYNANNLLNFVLYQVTNISNQPTDEYPVDVCGGYSVATELLADPLPDFYISQTNLNFTQNNLLQQFRQNLTNAVEPVYYFHSDHLGSASWITNNTGLPVQHLLYLPFGEHFVNERNTAYDERFTFTGKERDAETGYYYHGARFNSSDIGWLSVDPMSDKYPFLTPYNYCAWNPIKLVDPDGMDWFENEETGAIYYNNKYGKDAAGKGVMKGSGWKHLGGNNMFSTDGAHNSDISIVTNNGGTLFFGESGVYMELSLNEERAKSLMESLGYKQVPTQVITYNDTYTEAYPAAPGHNISITYGVQYEYTEKMAYVPKSYVERSRKIIGKTVYGDLNDIKYNMPYANREKISYYEPCTFIKGLKTLFSGFNTIHGGLHDYVNYYNMGNISRYKGDNDLINKILNR